MHWLTLSNINHQDPGSWILYDSLNNVNYIKALIFLCNFNYSIKLLNLYLLNYFLFFPRINSAAHKFYSIIFLFFLRINSTVNKFRAYKLHCS